MREGWTYKKLGEITKVINGLWIGKKPPLKTVAVIRNTNFTKDCKLSTTNIAYIDVEEKQFEKRRLLQGDIIIEKSGGSEKQPVGRPILFNLIGGEFSFSNFTSVIRIDNPNEIISSFLHLALYGAYLRGETLKMQAKTTGIHNLDFKAYNRILIPIPSLQEQQQIVSELDLLSSVIEMQKTQIEDLDKLAQSIFYDMFGDPVENEKGWDFVSMQELYEVRSSKRVYQNEQTSSGVPFLRVADIVSKIENKEITPDLYISFEKYESLKASGFVPNAGDLLVTSRGTLGRIYVIKDNERFYFQDGMITWLIDKKGKTVPIFSKYMLECDAVNSEMIKSSNNSTVAFISISKLSKIKIPLPPLSLQQEFAQKIEAIESMKAKVRQSLKESEMLFNSRMDYYFN